MSPGPNPVPHRASPSVAALFVLVLAAVPAAAAEPPVLYPRDVLERSIAAMGGLEVFARLREVRLEHHLSEPGGGSGSSLSVQTTRFPHSMWLELHENGRTRGLRYEGMRVTVAESDTPRPADEATRDWFRAFYWRQWWVIYARYAWHGLGEVWIDGPETVQDGARTYHVLHIQPRDAGDYRLFIDADTWRPAKREFVQNGRTVTDVYSDFRLHDGVLFPRHLDSFNDGQHRESIRVAPLAFQFDPAPLTLRRHLDAILEASRSEKRIPGLVAMIQRGDEILFHRAYGLSSVEFDLPATTDSVFPLASVSKIFAGTLALKLVEQGLLGLDLPIGSYLDGVPSSHAAITVRHLLNHSDGLAGPHSDRPPPAAEETRSERLRRIFERPLGFTPGRRWAYNPLGFEVLQAVIEAVTGTDYETVVEREIFTPLGMTRARFGGSDRIVHGRPPMDYGWDGDELTYNALDYSPSNFAAAGLNATAGEVMALYRALASGSLFSPATRDEMWREVILETGEPTYYGLGWTSFRTIWDGRWSVGHSGGGSSWTGHFPDSDLTVVVLSNLNGARKDKLIHDLATAIDQDELLSPRNPLD